MSKTPRALWRTRRTLTLPVQAPQEGDLDITWGNVRGADDVEVVFASASAHFEAAGPAKVRLRATRAGLKRFRGRRPVRIDATAAFHRGVITTLLPGSDTGTYVETRRFTLR